MTTARPRASLRETRLEAIAYGAVAVTARSIAAAGVELTFLQWRVLVIVGDAADGVSVSEVAARIDSDISATSRLVGRVARRGLVTARKDSSDRRVTRVELTDDGRRLRELVLMRRRELLTNVLADAGPIDADGEALLRRIGLAFRRYL